MSTRIIVFCIGVCLATSCPANSTPLNNPGGYIISEPILLKKIAALKIKDLQKLINRKLTLKEKIVFGILKHKLKQKFLSAGNTTKGETALVFGIVALASLLVSFFLYPFFIFGALVSAILAIVVGSSALKKNSSDKKAKTGKLLGWIALGLIAAILVLVVAALNSLQFF